jgi:hypothetical protein
MHPTPRQFPDGRSESDGQGRSGGLPPVSIELCRRGNHRPTASLSLLPTDSQEETDMAAKKPDAIALLKDDHRTVEDLFEQFSKARTPDKKRALVEKICTELMVHTMIEEEIFYPSLRGKIEDSTLDEAQVEHDGAKVMIAELLDCEPEAGFYDAKVTVLSEEIKHHVKEEEKPSEGMFAQARAADVDLQDLGDQMRTRKKELQGKFKAEGLPKPTTRSFRGAQVEYGQPVA